MQSRSKCKRVASPLSWSSVGTVVGRGRWVVSSHLVVSSNGGLKRRNGAHSGARYAPRAFRCSLPSSERPGAIPVVARVLTVVGANAGGSVQRGGAHTQLRSFAAALSYCQCTNCLTTVLTLVCKPLDHCLKCANRLTTVLPLTSAS